jgi:hypothetical protein
LLAPSSRVLFSWLGLKGRWCTLKEVVVLLIYLMFLGLLFLLGAGANKVCRVIRVHIS